MALSLTESRSPEFRNARFLAKACDLAYYDAPKGRELFQSELGLDATLISVDNTQVYVATDDKNLIVAFRGSQSPDSLDGFKDWLVTNANNFLVLPEGRIGTDFAAAGVGARFHRGFMEALAEIWDPLKAKVEAAQAENERPLWVTGHSLGGALALLAAWRFQRQFLPICQVYTFGSPMIGNAAASEAFRKELDGKIFRYVDRLDPIPLLPRMSLVATDYDHCHQECALEDVAAGPEVDSSTQVLQNVFSVTVDGVLHATMVDEVWGQLRNRISKHMMTNYEARIAEKCTDPA